MYNFMVTCGRGLENFVIEEIKEKIKEASNILPVNEGKVSFRISSSTEAALDPEAFRIRPEFSNIFKLKLVERIFLLLFHEKIEKVDLSLEDVGVVEKICSSVNWGEVTTQVKILLSQFSPTRTTPCLCIPKIAFVNEIGDLDSKLGSFEQKVQKQKRPCDDFSSVKKMFKIDQPVCSDDSIGKLLVKENKMLLKDHSAQLLTSHHCESDVKTYLTQNSPYSYDLPIQFRASCRITGKWKKLFNNRIGVECSNSVENQDTASKTLTSNLSMPETSITNSHLPVVNTDNVATLPCLNSSELLQSQDKTQQTDNKFEPMGNCEKTGTSTVIQTQKCTNASSTREDRNFNSTSIENYEMKLLATSTSSDTSLENITEKNGNIVHGSRDKNATVQMRNLRNEFLSTLLETVLRSTQGWSVDWNCPHVDVYLNITDLHVLLGVALCRNPLSLRPYIPHIGLRSTLSYLMVHLALNAKRLCAPTDRDLPCEAKLTPSHDTPVPQSFNKKHYTLLDPMCGAGTLIAEAINSFDVSVAGREQCHWLRCVCCAAAAGGLQPASCCLPRLAPAC